MMFPTKKQTCTMNPKIEVKNDADIRCGTCNRKLGEGQYSHLKIKCQRCGTLNSLRATEHPLKQRPIPECHRAPFQS
jgi:phage FluMu protein Com